MSYVINPGTGPVENSDHAQARKNLEELLREAIGMVPEIIDLNKEEEGRFDFDVVLASRRVPFCVPGIENLRDSWTRLYVDGNSWRWEFAVDIVRAIVDPVAELVKNPDRLRSFLHETLEGIDGACLDDYEDRKRVVDVLVNALTR